MAIQPITFAASSTTPSNQPGNSSVGGIHPITFGNTPGASQPTPTPQPTATPKTVATPQVGKPLNFIQQAENAVGNFTKQVIDGINFTFTTPKIVSPIPQADIVKTAPQPT